MLAVAAAAYIAAVLLVHYKLLTIHQMASKQLMPWCSFELGCCEVQPWPSGLGIDTENVAHA